MLKSHERLIVWRYISSRKKDGFISLTAILSVIAISLSVAALIVVMSIMNGYRVTLLDKILGYHGHIEVQGYGGKIEDYQTLLESLGPIEGVKALETYSQNQVMVTKNGQAYGAVVRGVPEAELTTDAFPADKIVAGRVEAAENEEGLIIGAQIARRLGVGVGQTITVVSPKPVDTPFGSSLRYLDFPVVAIVEVGVYDFDEVFVAMPLSLAQRFFRLGDSVSNINIFLNDPEAVSDILPAVQEAVGRRAYVAPWTQFNQALLGALDTERVAMFLILSLFIVVAVFNIASSLYMLVKEKAGDIAILRTMGMEQGAIRRIFMGVGLAVGVSGILLGALLATLFILNLDAIRTGIESLLGISVWDAEVRFIDELNAIVDPVEVQVTIAVAIFLTFLATLMPASKAAKLDPVEVLRSEG